MPLVYASGPISKTDYEGATSWYSDVEGMLSHGIRLVKPMRGKEFLRSLAGYIGDHAYDDGLFATSAAITGRDHFDVRRCDAVLMNLAATPDKVSIGCMIEAGWLSAYGKPLVLLSGDNNIHTGHPILEGLVTYRVQSLADAALVLNTLFANG